MARRTTPLRGRDELLSTLLADLEHSAAGHAMAVVVSGDAGVGKSRLVAEASTVATDRGATVLTGHCLDFGDAALPFLPVQEMYSRFADEHPERAAALREAHPAVARLTGAPDLPTDRPRADHPHADPPRALDLTDARLDRSALYEAITASWIDLASENPVVLVIEDVHWADQSTRDLLGFLFARLGGQRLAVIASLRSDDLHRRHPLRRALAEWTRLPAVERLDVRALPDHAVADLVRDISPAASDAVVSAVVARAGGNAFFAEELAAAGGGGDALPADLADVLLVRFDRLSDTARLAARALAVAGRPVSHSLLKAVTALDDASLDDAVREAVDAHLIEARPAGYAFHHALMGEAVRDDLLPGERSRLHATFVAVLTAEPGLGSFAELAHHARGAHDLEAAYRAGVRAGDEALEVGAPVEAARQYELSLELVDRVATASDVRPRWELVTDLIDSLIVGGFLDRAADLVAVELGRSNDLDPLGRAELLRHAALVHYYLDDRSRAGDEVDEALSLLDDREPDPVVIGLWGLKARLLDSLGRWREAREFAERAVAVADANEGDLPDRGRSGVADVRATLAVLSRRTAEPAQAARDLRELAEYARSVGARSAELRGRYSLGNVSYESGAFDDAIDAYGEAIQIAEKAGQLWSPYGVSAMVVRSIALYESGRFDEALAGIDYPDVPPSLRASVQTVRALIVAAKGGGDVVTARASRAGWSTDPQVAVIGAAAEAEILADVEGFAAGREHLDAAIGMLEERWPDAEFMARIRMTALGLALAADHAPTMTTGARADVLSWATAQVEAARRAVQVAVPNSSEVGPEGIAWRMRLEAEWGRVQHALGQDAGAASDHVDRWRAAVEAFNYGARYERARSQVQLAFAYRSAGDIDQAQATADEARTTARAIGAAPLLARLAELAVPERTGTTKGSRPSTADAATLGGDSSGPGTPTPREQEVLELIAQGETNRQIARHLFISEKTVSVHVSNLLAKLGAATRTEAAAIARRAGLVGDEKAGASS